MNEKIYLVFMVVCLIAALVVVGAVADDEVTVTARLVVDNGNFKFDRNVSNLKVDQAGTAMDSGVQAFTNSATNVLTISNVDTPHYAYMRNISTNVPITVTLTLRFLPGDIAVLPVLSTNIAAYTTNAAAGSLEWAIHQE